MRGRRIRLKPRFYVIAAVFMCLCISLICFLLPGSIPYKMQYSQGTKPLPQKAEALMEDFMKEAYKYMASWEKTDLTKRFSDKKGEAALICQTSYDLMIEMRSLRDVDLHCKIKKVEITVSDVSHKDGLYTVNFEEAYDCRFSFMEELSQTRGIESSMVIEESKGKYSIVSYDREEDFYSLISEAYQKGNENPKEELQAIKEDFVARFKEELKLLDAPKENIDENPQYCHIPFDRQTAKKYAMTYALTRNKDWFAFDDLGGNCQNFGSQVLFAGGIPMDLEGDVIWKYYGTEPSGDNETQGRSSSWTGVTNFYAYAWKNDGFGLCADTDANIYAAEAGDIIQVADGKGQFVHTVVSLGPITDSEGNIIDINTVSNTTDRKNYPLAAYNNLKVRLIKIYGYNN